MYARRLGRSGFLAIAALAGSACVVSFDGYELEDGAAGSSGSAHGGSAGSALGGADAAGHANGGSAGQTSGGNTNAGAGGMSSIGGKSGASGASGAGGASGHVTAGHAGSAGNTNAGAGGNTNAGAGGNTNAGAGGTIENGGSGGTVESGGSGGSTESGGSGGTIDTAGAGGTIEAGGSGGTIDTAGAGGTIASGGSGGTIDTAGAGGTIESAGAGGQVAGAGGTIGAAGSTIAGAGGSVAGAGGAPFACPTGGPGSDMVEAKAPNGTPYCIDATEVTQLDYDDFLNSPTKPAPIGVCTWNTDYAPQTTTTASNGCGADPYAPTNNSTRPVSCIDWCDAYSYCEYVGKRLCGAIGGGATPTGSFADNTSSQWYNACAGPLKEHYPYGNSWVQARCGDLYGDEGNVASRGACVGGVSSLYDMSGNVAEWEDGCGASSGTGSGDACGVRGGDYLSNEVAATHGNLTCESADQNGSNFGTPKLRTFARNAKNHEVGFRCCLD